MATPPKYRLTLESTNVSSVLSHSPTNWQEIQVMFGRNSNYHGIIREYSTDYAFVKEGAKLLRSVYYTEGSEGKCKIKIEKRQSAQWIYTPFIYTDLDFSKSNDERDTFTISAMEGGAVALIKAFEDTEYEVPIDGPEVVTVDVNPMMIQGEIRWLSAWPIPAQGTDLSPFNTLGGTVYYLAVDNTMFSNADGPPAEIPSAQEYQSRPLDGNWFGTQYLMRARTGLFDVSFTGQLKMFFENTSGSAYTARVILAKLPVAGSGAAATIQTLSIVNTTAHSNNNVIIDINIPLFNLIKDEKVILYFSWTGPNGTLNASWEKDSYLKAKFKNFTGGFSLKGLRSIEVFKRLVSQITDGQYSADSDLLNDRVASYIDGVDNRPYDTIITSGDAVRNTVTSGSTVPVIKIKLSDFFKATDVWWSTGLSIENDVVRIEKKSRFYDKTTIIADLGMADKVQVQHATDFLFNKINIGYENQEYDDLNGRDEFNTTHIYSAPVVTKQATLDLISPIRADSIGIFFSWAKYVATDSSDSSSDNDIFAIEIEASAKGNGNYATLKLPGTRTGMIDPENTFNYGLSPLRCLIRNFPFLKSLFYGLTGKSLTFQTTDKNAEMGSTLSYGLVDEDADVSFDSMGNALFQPFNMTVTAVSSENILQALNDMPYGVFTFIDNGIQYKAFNMTSGVKPAFPEEYEFQLLSSPDNDLSKRVR